MKAKKTLILSIVLLLFLVAACGGDETPEPTLPAEAFEAATPAEPSPATKESDGDDRAVYDAAILRVGGMQDIDCWNPFSCTAVYQWGDLIVEGLVDQGPASGGCPGKPAIAKSWERSADGRTWTIRLHEGITFSDGTPVTAGTVKELLEWWNANDEIAVFQAEILSLESVEAIDDLTLRYTTVDPIINSPDYAWPFLWILPPHIWLEVDPEDLFSFEFDPPVGTGPYTLTEYVPGSHMIFDAREDYYRGKPPIDRVIYTIYPGADTLNNALLAGEIDLTLPFLPPENYGILSGGPNITIEEKYPGDSYNLVFNMSSAGTMHPAIQDPAIRRAIDHAIDKQQVVDEVFLGHAVTCSSNWACGPNYEGEVNPDLAPTPFDLGKASQILEEAGYADADGDGVHESPTGQRLEFRLVYASDFPTGPRVTELITAWLGEIGIAVKVEAVDWVTWYDIVTNQRDFDMAIDIALGDIDPASMDYWHSCWAADAGGYTTSGYCNEEMDALVYEYWFSPDEQARWEPMFEAQRMLHEDRPFVVLAGPYQVQAYRNDRFEFPADTCYDGFGILTPQGLLDATVK